MKVKIKQSALQIVVQQMNEIVKNADKNRYTMQQVRCGVTFERPGWIVQSTDGHRAIQTFIAREELSVEHDQADATVHNVFFELRHLKTLQAFQKSTEDEIDVTAWARTAGEKIEDIYPDVSALFKKQDGYHYEISFNAIYLYEMLKAMRDHRRVENVVLKIKNNKEPIRVTCGGTSFGLLMPVRHTKAWPEMKTDQAFEDLCAGKFA